MTNNFLQHGRLNNSHWRSQNENPAEGAHFLDAPGKIISQQGTGGSYIVKEMDQISVLDDEKKNLLLK